MNSTDNQTSADERSLLGDPDCLECLRQKLNATCVAVFFVSDGQWRLGHFQGDKPRRDAEVDFYCMLESPAPQAILNRADGVLLSDDQSLAGVFGSAANLLRGQTVIGAPVQSGSARGVRVAWRDNAEPFKPEDLELIRCSGLCP